ncbi:MAG: choice-of-anchor D domain-containing protein [Myxococcota bacterium]
MNWGRNVTALRPLVLGLVCSACQCGEDGLQSTKAILEVTPDKLDFGEVGVGDLRALGLHLKNSGNSALHLTDFALTSTGSEFSRAADPPTALAPGESADVSFLYQPTNLGEDLGQLRVVADSGQDPFLVRLRGVGVAGSVRTEGDGEACPGVPGSISFGSTAPNTTVDRHITVRASGTAPITITQAMLEPGPSTEFSIDAAALPKTLAPGETLVLTIHYTPVDGGADSGSFAITTDLASTPTLHVAVCGTGVAPAICAHPVPLDLGAVRSGSTAVSTLTLESCGALPLDLSAIAMATDVQHPSDPAFSLVMAPGLPTTLAPGATVDVRVRFTASPLLGPRRAWIAVDSSALGSPHSFFPVTAHVAAPCGLAVDPAVLTYYGVAAGTTDQRSVLISNQGEDLCVVQSLSISSTQAQPVFRLPALPVLPLSLPAGGAEILPVEYAPTGSGPDQARLVVTQADGSTLAVDLRGNPTIGDECVVDIRPSSLNFGVVPIGAAQHLAVAVSNVGNEACRIRSARILHQTPGFSAMVSGLGFLPPGVGSGSVDVSFAPTGPGAQADTLEIVVAGALGAMGGGTYHVGLAGLSGDARLCVTPLDLRFGAVTSGNHADRSVQISSCGSAPVNLRAMVLAPGSSSTFSIVGAPMVPVSLAPTATAAPALTVRYSPTSAGPHFGQIDVLSTDPNNPTIHVRLSGNWDQGCTKILECAPTSLDFGQSEVARSKLIRVVCRSAGPDPVHIAGAGLTGGSNAFSVVAQTPTDVAPGATFSFDAFYTPSAAAMDTATLAIMSDACLAPAGLPLSGQGFIPQLPLCQAPSTFSPTLKWEWTGSTVEPGLTNVWMTPLVANLTDDNGDGRIDENDVPEVLFVSFDRIPLTDPNQSRPGVLRVLSGDTGAERFSVVNPRFPDSGQLAVGDIDGDGLPEIIAMKHHPTPPGSGSGGITGRYTTGTLVALDHNGQQIWESDPYSWSPSVTWSAAGPAIADLDGDGYAEIILGRDVFDHHGHLLWRGTGDAGNVLGGPQSITADLDGDGHPEVIAGGTVYNRDGTIRWNISDSGEGGTGVGRLDPADPFPEVVLISDQVHVYDHLGNERWHAPIPTNGPGAQLPVIADFDGDGDEDIAVADGVGVHVYRGTGGIMWSGVVSDMTCCPGITAFDFEGDGAYELLLNDFGNVYVFRGSDGTVIYTAARPSETNLELPVVADVDNDGHAEIVVALESGLGSGGVKVYTNAGNHWVSAPRIWNQQSYSVDNVLENGAIPRVLPPMSTTGVFRGQKARCR